MQVACQNSGTAVLALADELQLLHGPVVVRVGIQARIRNTAPAAVLGGGDAA